ACSGVIVFRRRSDQGIPGYSRSRSSALRRASFAFVTSWSKTLRSRSSDAHHLVVGSPAAAENDRKLIVTVETERGGARWRHPNLFVPRLGPLFDFFEHLRPVRPSQAGAP